MLCLWKVFSFVSYLSTKEVTLFPLKWMDLGKELIWCKVNEPIWDTNCNKPIVNKIVKIFVIVDAPSTILSSMVTHSPYNASVIPI